MGCEFTFWDFVQITDNLSMIIQGQSALQQPIVFYECTTCINIVLYPVQQLFTDCTDAFLK